jgi:hypothetical protein
MEKFYNLGLEDKLSKKKDFFFINEVEIDNISEN